MKSVYSFNGPAVDISTGIGGANCSKRGSVALNFKVNDSCFRVINMHLKSDSLANRLRDLTKILEVNQLALEDKGTSIFLVGALNFKTQDGLTAKQDASFSRESCEILSLQKQTLDDDLASSILIPGIDHEL